MSFYYCKYCAYKTNIKSNYKVHLNTNKHKKNKELNGDVVSYKCKYCDKKYKHRQSLYRHQLKCNEQSKIDIDYLTKLENKVLELENKINNNPQPINSITNNIGTQNNSNNINNNNINIINNFKLLSLKNTDYAHLTAQDYKKILGRQNNCIEESLKRVHYNNKKPENMNLYIEPKQKYAIYFNGEEWVHKEKDEIIEYIMNAGEEYLEAWLEDNADCNIKLKESYEKYLENKDDPELFNQMKENIMLVMLNNRNKVKKNKKKINKIKNISAAEEETLIES